jgi:Transposase DDE domain
VAHELTQCGNDQSQLVPLIEAIENNLGRKPEQASADSGYCSESNLEALEAHGIDGYVAPGRAKHPTATNGKIGGPLTQQMRNKIDDGGFETPYRLRKQVVEPVFGQIKQARGFRQFLLRGLCHRVLHRPLRTGQQGVDQRGGTGARRSLLRKAAGGGGPQGGRRQICLIACRGHRPSRIRFSWSRIGCGGGWAASSASTGKLCADMPPARRRPVAPDGADTGRRASPRRRRAQTVPFRASARGAGRSFNVPEVGSFRKRRGALSRRRWVRCRAAGRGCRRPRHLRLPAHRRMQARSARRRLRTSLDGPSGCNKL